LNEEGEQGSVSKQLETIFVDSSSEEENSTTSITQTFRSSSSSIPHLAPDKVFPLSWSDAAGPHLEDSVEACREEWTSCWLLQKVPVPPAPSSPEDYQDIQPLTPGKDMRRIFETGREVYINFAKTIIPELQPSPTAVELAKWVKHSPVSLLKCIQAGGKKQTPPEPGRWFNFFIAAGEMAHAICQVWEDIFLHRGWFSVPTLSDAYVSYILQFIKHVFNQKYIVNPKDRTLTAAFKKIQFNQYQYLQILVEKFPTWKVFLKEKA